MRGSKGYIELLDKSTNEVVHKLYPHTKADVVELNSGKNIHDEINDVKDKMANTDYALNSLGIEVTNLIKDANFKGDGKYWSGNTSCKQEINDGVMKIISTGRDKDKSVAPYRTDVANDDKYLLAMVSARVDNSRCTSLRLQAGYNQDIIIDNPDVNKWYSYIKIVKTKAGQSNIFFNPAHYYDNNDCKEGDTMEITKPLLIDLTNDFGDGFEPSLEDMKGYLSKYEDMFFDGTVNNIVSIKDVYRKIHEQNKSLRNLIIDK